MTALLVEYENNDLIVINKPANLPVYSTKKHEQEKSVVSWFLKKYPKAKSVGEPERPGIVHRLDRQTSGLLVITKTPEAFEYLKKLFSSRNIVKEYIVLIYGTLPKHGIIEKPLSKIGYRGSSRVRVDEKGKMSVTEYWAVGTFIRPLPQPLPRPGEGGRRPGEVETPLDHYTLLRVKLHTGRTHQIRVHFASIRHPVMGDNLYGKPNSLKLKEILPRQFLHASRLEFKLIDGTWLEVESELPEDLQKVLDKLRKYESVRKYEN